MSGLSSVFGKRQNSQSDKLPVAPIDVADVEDTPVFNDIDYSASKGKDPETSTVATAPTKSNPRFSLQKSATTTRENSPPSPGSPLETASSEDPTALATVPSQDDFSKKKSRSSTGFSLRGRVIHFAQQHQPRRRKSAENLKQHVVITGATNSQVFHVREMQDAHADVGVGMKARRLSLSLPDNFAVDVIDLRSEFEFEHKYRGRHGRIGRGATSKLTTVHRKGFPKEIYVVKEFRKKESYETVEEYEKKVKSEFSIGKSLHHPNIVESIQLCTDHGRWNYVMEYCTGGDLYSLLQKGYLQKDDRTDDRACLAKQLIQGIAYLHRHGIAHRDIKLENLLLTHDSKLKITDFGVSEVFSGIHPGLREARGQCGIKMGDVRLCTPGICGSIPYMAPEVFQKKQKYDPRPIDIWSAGVCIIALRFGGAIWTSPCENKSPGYKGLVDAWAKFYKKNGPDAVVSDQELNFPVYEPFEVAFKSPSLRRLLWRMMNPDPSKRITAEEILQSRWHKNTACCQPESYDEPVCGVETTKMTGLTMKKRTVIHNHRPPVHHGTHSLGKMPGQAGY